APAASPTRLNRRPPGGAQASGVPLRRSAPRPRRHPPRSHVALVNNPGYGGGGEGAHGLLDQQPAARMFRCERGLCPRNGTLGGGSEGGRSPPPSVLGAGEQTRQLVQGLRDAWAIPGGELAVHEMDAPVASRGKIGTGLEVGQVRLPETIR